MSVEKKSSMLLTSSKRTTRKITTARSEQSDKSSSFCTPLYIQSTSEPIKRISGSFEIDVALKPHTTIGNMFPKPKDPIPKLRIKDYVGETKRQYKTRLGEHQKVV